MQAEFDFRLGCNDGTEYRLKPTSALFFVDETGAEKVNDPIYSIFGFGGCWILAGEYMAMVHTPWNLIRQTHFPDVVGPFHKADIGRFTDEQYSAIVEYFERARIGRFASVASSETQIPTNITLLQAVYGSLHNRILEMLKWMPFTDVFIILEDSNLKPKLERYSTGLVFCEEIDGSKKEIPIHYGVMSKKLDFPGLAVADYIIHTAGTTYRDLLNGKLKNNHDRLDFKAIFDPSDRKLSSFIYITSAIQN